MKQTIINSRPQSIPKNQFHSGSVGMILVAKYHPTTTTVPPIEYPLGHLSLGEFTFQRIGKGGKTG